MEGLIFNIQKYSIHDGPGIRTTVFLKGCPLSCSWCHNPESQSFEKELMFFPNRCINCGHCLKVCSHGRKTELCVKCGNCADACCTNAIEVAGREIRAEALVKELEKDIIFYDDSKGGITISGGEPLASADFTSEILQRCKHKEIHTAVDTSGFGNQSDLEMISKYADMFLYDLKLIDTGRHMQHTGVSNEIILENLKMLVALRKRIWIRIPIIPGINDDEENIAATAKLILNTGGIEQVNILPYHNAASDKYKRLDKTYELGDLKIPDKNHIAKIEDLFHREGVNVIIGG